MKRYILQLHVVTFQVDDSVPVGHKKQMIEVRKTYLSGCFQGYNKSESLKAHEQVVGAINAIKGV
jgi:hypothetical protein